MNNNVQELVRQVKQKQALKFSNVQAQEVHPELQALAEGYLANPYDKARAGVIADWLQENGHPMADTYRWYLNNAANIVRESSGYNNPVPRTSNEEEFVPTTINGPDSEFYGRHYAANKLKESLGLPATNLLQTAMMEHFRPHITAHSHGDSQPSTLKKLAAKYEMSALGILPTGSEITDREVRKFNTNNHEFPGQNIANNASRFSGSTDFFRGDTSLRANVAYHNTLNAFHDRFNEALIPHESGQRVFNPTPDPKHPKQVLFAKSLPIWIPKETKGKEESTGFIPVQSSWIAGLKYTPERGSEMTVKKGGKSYAYPGLNLAIFRRWVASKSPGKAWWRYVGYPMQNSRWTGPVHPMFDGDTDGPLQTSGYGVKHDEAMDFLKTINPNATPAHLAAITRWLPDTTSTLRIIPSREGAPPTLMVSSVDPKMRYHSSTDIMAPHQGDVPGIYNNTMHITNHRMNPYLGSSGPLLLRQMRAAFELGIPKMYWHSAHDSIDHGPDRYTGGLHWPLLGADGYIPEDWLTKKIANPQTAAALIHANKATKGAFFAAPAYFKTFQHLFSSPLGRQAWVDDPAAHYSFAETHPGSYSRRAVERHVAENAAKNRNPGPVTDEQLPKLPLAKMPNLYGEKLDHLIHTGSLHPDHFDSYFEN